MKKEKKTPLTTTKKTKKVTSESKSKKYLTLISSDEQEFKVLISDCALSLLLQKFLAEKKSKLSLAIPSNQLVFITTFLQHYKGKAPPEIKRPVRHLEMKLITDKWSACFIDEITNNSLQDLYNLTFCAHQLNIPSLLDLCCAKIATFIKGKPLATVLTNLRGAYRSKAF